MEIKYNIIYTMTELTVSELQNQLTIARKEINNLRQQLTTLNHVHRKEIETVAKQLEKFQCPSCRSNKTVVQTRTEDSQNDNNQHYDFKTKYIGVIKTNFPEKRGTPRQPGICHDSIAKLTLNNDVFTNPEHSIEGLQEFSHMWILFHFHKNDSTHVRAKVAPPRLNGIRMGVFATRSPHRPAPIGLSLVRIDRILENTIYFSGVDMIDQTPVIDIKPYIPQYDSPNMAQLFYPEESVPDYFDSGVDLVNNMAGSSRSTGNGVGSTSSNQNGIAQTSRSNRRGEIDIRNAESMIGTGNVSNDIRIVSSDIRNVRNDISHLENDIRHLQNDIQTYANPESRQELEGQENERRDLILGAPSNENLNLRNEEPLFNRSASRMGEREAPDGEEEESPSTAATSSQITTPDGRVRVPPWIDNAPVVRLTVSFKDRALAQLAQLGSEGEEKKTTITNVLREDPRSVYLRERWGSHCYVFRIAELYVSCKFNDSNHSVTVYQVFQNEGEE